MRRRPPRSTPFPYTTLSRSDRLHVVRATHDAFRGQNEYAGHQRIDLPGVTMHSPEATYLAWLDFTDTAIAADPATPLLERGRLALHGGAKFCPTAEANARINFATSPAIIDEIVARIAHTLATA